MVHSLQSKLVSLPQDVSNFLAINNLRAILSLDPNAGRCMSRLPPELIREIFLLCQPGEPYYSSKTWTGQVLSPLVLSHVCRRWRAIALSYATLWSTVWVYQPSQEHIPMVKTWLERSGQQPLTIHITQTEITDWRQPRYTDEIMWLLIPQLHRWGRLNLYLLSPLQHSLHTLFWAPRKAPLLTHVYVSAQNWVQGLKPTLERGFLSFPSIRSVVLPPSVNLSFVPFAQLTVIDASLGGCFTPDVLLDTLRRCGQLRSLALQLGADRSGGTFVPHHTSLPYLSDLKMTVTAVNLTELFDCLTLPCLDKLMVHYNDAPHVADDARALDRLLIRSKAFLKRLDLADPQHPGIEWHLSWLQMRSMQRLEELYMHIALDDAFVAALTLRPDLPSSLFPGLRTLYLHDAEAGQHLNDLELYRMVVSRIVPLTIVALLVRIAGHHAAPALPFLIERCKNHISLALTLLPCGDPTAKTGRYLPPPMAGGYCVE
ncbi:unnamed protein product [Mycena citricolor]|uniref:F-box domain-containing protein n=1 Tax=Mycena citricolor TaxID=2018698 RepID=A0AAD2GYC1_9AGAR|nr:unnamed protein product [Mycena citricolor]